MTAHHSLSETTSMKYIYRATVSIVPLAFLIYLQSTSLIDLANAVAVSLLVSQIIFRIVSYGWSISHLKDRGFKRQSIVIWSMILISVTTFLFRENVSDTLLI